MMTAVGRSALSTDVAAVVGRILLVILFVVAGWIKVKNGSVATAANFAKLGVPLPSLAYYVALLVELPLAVLFLVGWQTSWIALVLAIWCVVSALFGHSNFGDYNQFVHFLKNLGLAGGFLHAFALGGGKYSIDGWRTSET